MHQPRSVGFYEDKPKRCTTCTSDLENRFRLRHPYRQRQSILGFIKGWWRSLCAGRIRVETTSRRNELFRQCRPVLFKLLVRTLDRTRVRIVELVVVQAIAPPDIP